MKEKLEKNELDIAELAIESKEPYIDIEWDIIRKQVLRRDRHKCKRCESKGRLTIHHIKPRNENGTDALHNLITLCEKCHDLIEVENVQSYNLIINWPEHDTNTLTDEKQELETERVKDKWLFDGQWRRFTELFDIVQKANSTLTEQMFKQRLAWQWWDTYNAMYTPPILTELGNYV